jgi:hypothetical protein
MQQTGRKLSDTEEFDIKMGLGKMDCVSNKQLEFGP